MSVPISTCAGGFRWGGRNLGAAVSGVTWHPPGLSKVTLRGGLGTGNTGGPGSPHQCPRLGGVPGNMSIAFTNLAEEELRDRQREDAWPSHQKPATLGFFSCCIKLHTFFLLFNFLLLHPQQVHSEARNLFPIEFVLVVLFGKGQLPQPWSP